MIATVPVRDLAPDDLQAAARICRETLGQGLELNWGAPAGDLEWDCRRTLEHIVDALCLYIAYFASRATARLQPPRDGNPEATPASLLELVDSAASVLADLARAAPGDARAFHPAGLADVSGWIGMGCEEILLHTDDIALGLGIQFRPPHDLVRPVLTRLFPWAPTDVDAWAALRWAAGRAGLPERERLGPDWYWHCAPLADWDGAVKRRTAPPAWR
jgi:hypothetical protein